MRTSFFFSFASSFFALSFRFFEKMNGGMAFFFSLSLFTEKKMIYKATPARKTSATAEKSEKETQKTEQRKQVKRESSGRRSA